MENGDTKIVFLSLFMSHLFSSLVNKSENPETRGFPFSTYTPRGRGGIKSPIHFHCVLHAKQGGGGVQITCKIAYVLNGKPHGKK